MYIFHQTIFLLTILGSIRQGFSIRCYECSSELIMGEYDPCFYGEHAMIRPVMCQEPSVCAAYHYRAETPYGTKLSTSRGCQAVRFGSTCEDIFNELRRTNSILPGQHTCTTCDTNLCNSAFKLSSSNMIVLISTFIILIIH